MIRLFREKENCCGCTACEQICPSRAITMQADEEGFLYPAADGQKCTSCGLCEAVCVMQNPVKVPDRLALPPVYAAHSRSAQVVERSSSGGMFFELSSAILQRGGTVYGAAFDDRFQVTHIRAESESERDRCLGSKYSQSFLEDTFLSVQRDLREGRTVLFTGTPCQNAGLRSFLSEESTEYLYLAEVVCHGTPSPMLFREYLDFVEAIRKKRVQAYFHRSKELGWKHREKTVFTDGTTDCESALSQAFKWLFYSHTVLRPSCYVCPFAQKQRDADLTLGDFWGIEEFDPAAKGSRGVSLITVNTEKGQKLLAEIRERITLNEYTPEQAAAKNPQLRHPPECPADRDAAWAEYRKNGIGALLRRYGHYRFKNRMAERVKQSLRRVGILSLLKKIVGH